MNKSARQVGRHKSENKVVKVGRGEEWWPRRGDGKVPSSGLGKAASKGTQGGEREIPVGETLNGGVHEDVINELGVGKRVEMGTNDASKKEQNDRRAENKGAPRQHVATGGERLGWLLFDLHVRNKPGKIDWAWIDSR